MSDNLLVDTTNTALPVPGPIPTHAVSTEMQIDDEDRPIFPPAKDSEKSYIVQSRKVQVPLHRMAPLKSTWSKMCPPLVSHLKLQVRMNMKSKAIELRTSKYTSDDGAIQKGEDFVVCTFFDCRLSVVLADPLLTRKMRRGRSVADSMWTMQ